MDLIEKALSNGQRSLSEFDSKRFLGEYGIAVTREEVAHSKTEAQSIAEKIAFPVALKGVGAEITHKTDKELLELHLKSVEEVGQAYDNIVLRAGDNLEGVLVQEMVTGRRELLLGLSRDPQFGPCVMFGLGGILAEVLNDVSFRIAPLDERDAMEMMKEIRAHKILDTFRGEPSVDLNTLARYLITLGEIGLKYSEIKEIDINPMIASSRGLVAVDALMILEQESK